MLVTNKYMLLQYIRFISRKQNIKKCAKEHGLQAA